MTPRPDPWMIAHFDQAAAADDEAAEVFYTTVADKDGTLTSHLPASAEQALHQGWARLCRAHAGGEFACRHLSPRTPEVTLWTVSTDPARVNCYRCAFVEGLRLRGTDDDFRCDLCGVVDRVGQVVYQVLIPSKVSSGGYSPPILATIGICGPCHAT